MDTFRADPDAVADLARTEEHVALDLDSLARTEELPFLRPALVNAPDLRDVRDVSAPTPACSVYPEIDSVESQTGDSAGEDGDSDVFVCRRSSPPPALDAFHDPQAEELAQAAQAAAANVTLFVYGWDSVEPGPLSWVFPSLRAALDAVRTMRNAIEWSIVSGREHTTIESARESGDVLVEQSI